MKNACPVCKKEASYDEEWDSKFCSRCNQWLEEKCKANPNDDPRQCYFKCWNRPEKPLQKIS